MQKALKRWINATAVLFAVTLIGATTGLAQVTVSLDEITGRPGESAMVAIDISGVESGPAIRSFNFQVVADPGVTWTGVNEFQTLSGNSFFQTGINLGTGVVGSFSTAPSGTDIGTSGTLIYLTFDLDAESAGNVTLANFTFNDGNPAVTGSLTALFTVSTRIISVTMEHSADVRPGEAYTNSDQDFRILVNIEDALVAGDNVIAFNFDLNYDPALMTIDKSKGFNGVGSNGTLAEFAVVNGNDAGAGVYRVGGFSLNAITGDGLFVWIAATATSATGIGDLRLTNVVLNAGTPIYAARSGTLTVLPFNVANEDELDLPSEFTLKGNYPNPFNPSTTIQFDLPESADVSVAVMDLLGRQVMSIPVQAMSAGANRTVRINATALSSGIYLYRITAITGASTSVRVGTMTLLK